MAKFSGAKWVPVKNFTKGGQEEVLGLVVHIMDGTLEGSQSWFNNSASQASSTFGTGKDGELRQWVDTADRAWAQGSGNKSYVSIENEGHGGDSLTKAQITAIAKVLLWLHDKYKVPLTVAHKPGEKGLGYHAMGGAAWGGHLSCPGSKIVAQLDDIVAMAKALLWARDGGGPKPAPHYAPFPGTTYFKLGKKGKLVLNMGKAIVKAGYKAQYTPTEEFTRADLKAYAWWQRKLGYSGASADGYPGKASWDKLHVAP